MRFCVCQWLVFDGLVLRPDGCGIKLGGSSLFSVGNLVRRAQPTYRCATPVQGRIRHKRHPSRRKRAPAIYFVSLLSRLCSALEDGNGVLRSIALGSFLAAGSETQKLLNLV